MDRRQRIPLRTTMVPDSFKVLPPLSPELPAPPPAPKPVRVAPLTVSRRDESAFVILAESNSRTTSPAPVTGRVSPFRAHGFKTPASSRHPSRDPSPNRSRSRLPVARPTGRSSVSSSPARNVSTSVPKPIIRRNSLSPNRATKVMTQVSRNKSFVSIKNTQNLNVPVNKANITSPQRRLNKQSPKRVGPLNVKNENSNLIISKPPIPKTVQKKVDAGNVKQNNLPSKRQNISNIKSGTVLQSPSRIPRGQKVNPGKNISPTKKLPPKVKPKPTPQPRTKVNESISRPSSTNHDKTIDQSSNVDSKQKGTKTPIELDHDKSSRNVVEHHEDVKHDSVKQNVDETLVKYTTANHSTESEPNKSNDSEHDYPEVTSSDGLSIKSKVTITSLPDEDMTETSLTLVRTTTAPALELAQPDVIPNILSPNIDKIDLDKVETFGKITVDKMLDKIEDKSNEMELRHVEIKEKVMKVDNNAATDNILQTIPAHSDNMTLTGLSVESVRSTSSVETVRAVAKVKVHLKKHEEDVKGSIKEDADAEVLSANNLIRTDSINNNSNNRTVAWENTTTGEASVYPVEPIIVQPPKPKGCCGKFLDKISCKCCKTSPSSDKKYSGCFGKFCNKLNCCKKSSCCKKQKEERPKPIPPSRQKKSKLKECLSRLNCCRSIKCCKKTQRPLEEDNEDIERPSGCCAGCKTKTKKCCNALFCMNLSCCQKLRLCSGCTRFNCCRSGGCCGPSPPDLDRRKSRQSLKRSQTTSMIGLPKLDSTLVEHTAFIRGAIPVLPVPLAWICLIFNVFLPGIGTLLSGMFCLCVGKPRFSINDSHADRLKAFCINIIIAVAQVFSIIFCLVGWGWSIWWGVIMLRLAKKNRRIQLAEKNTEQPVPVALNQNHDVERAR